MPIAKIINKKDKITGKGKYKDDEAREAVYNYIFDNDHPYDSQKIHSNYIGGSHVDMADPVKSMEEVAERFHKNRGIRLKHIIISYSKEDGVSNSMAACEAEEISQQIGMIYQNVYAVHEDKSAPHIHFMLNTVNHINGYKFNAKEDKPWLRNIIQDSMDRLQIDSYRFYGR